MTLEEVRDYVDSLGLSEHVFMGKLDSKPEKSVGVYIAKNGTPFKTAIGGRENESYGIKALTFLVHWNRSPRETEKAAAALYDALMKTREVETENGKIKFMRMRHDEPVDIGTDEAGTYEMVIDAEAVYERKA